MGHDSAYTAGFDEENAASHDPLGLRRLLDRSAQEHEVHAYYEASGAGYVLERMIRSWGQVCQIVARR